MSTQCLRMAILRCIALMQRQCSRAFTDVSLVVGLPLQDMLDVIDVEGKRDPGTYLQNQGGFDLIWANGPVQQFEKPTSLPTLLGCYNARDQNQLRKPLHADSSVQQRFRKTRSHNGSSSGLSSSGSSNGRPGSSGSSRGQIARSDAKGANQQPIQ